MGLVVVFWVGLRRAVCGTQRFGVHVFQGRRHAHEPFAHWLLQDLIDDGLGPRLDLECMFEGVPGQQLVIVVGQKMVHHGRHFEVKGLVQNHRHHFRVQVHQLQQETELLAFVGQALAQHIFAVGVKAQIVKFCLVGAAQFEEKRGYVHRFKFQGEGERRGAK